MSNVSEISRPALKYNGGKFRLREWITSYFPNHHTYVETCFGAGSVMLGKNRASVEIANDIDPNIDNFFEVLRDHPRELIRMIEFTPYSENSMQIGAETLNSGDKIRRAWAFYTICFTSLRANDLQQSSLNFRFKGNLEAGSGRHNPAKLFAQIKHLYKIAKRLRGVIVTSLDAEKCIKTFDSVDTLFYVDLPYLGESRKTKRLYNHELTDRTSHARILQSLSTIKGMAVVSHYIHPLYESILEGWEVVTKQTLSNSFKKGRTLDDIQRTEALY